MLNQVVMVGRIVKEPELKKVEKGEVCNTTLEIPRSYKNVNGEYDTDMVDCVLWNSIAKSTTEYCHKGDLVGVKGRIETRMYENEEGINQKQINVIAEKITFLSTQKTKDKEDEIE